MNKNPENIFECIDDVKLYGSCIHSAITIDNVWRNVTHEWTYSKLRELFSHRFSTCTLAAIIKESNVSIELLCRSQSNTQWY